MCGRRDHAYTARMLAAMRRRPHYALTPDGRPDYAAGLCHGHWEEVTRPTPIRLDGCTCGGIGDTGSHRRGCPWAARP